MQDGGMINMAAEGKTTMKQIDKKVVQMDMG